MQSEKYSMFPKKKLRYTVNINKGHERGQRKGETVL